MSDEEHLTISDVLSASHLKRVMADAVARAPIGVAVLDVEGNLLAETYAELAACPQLIPAAAGGSQCPHAPADMAWLVATHRSPVEGRCPQGACRRAYPLTYRDRLLGSLVTCSYNGAAQELIETVAVLTVERLHDLIVAGFELQSLSREIVANYEQLTLFYGSSAEVGASHDVTAICERALDQINAQVPSEAIAVLLLDEETGHARVAAARGELSDAFHLPMPEMPGGILSHVLATGQVAVVCDVPRPSGETSSILCVPLTTGGGPAAHSESALEQDLMVSGGECLLGAICARDKLSGEEYLAGDAKLVAAIASQAAIAISNAILFGDVKSLFIGTVRSLASAVDAKDPCTLGHSQRVTQYALAVAQDLRLPAPDIEDLQLAALLHDVGKIGLPDEILLKAGKLTEREWEQVRKHPIWGQEILRPIKQLHRVASWIRHEHERWNGSGYPDGLRGADIPLPSRIIAVADAFDAITSDRSYRKAIPVREAMTILESAAGSEYDPEVVAAFLAAIESGKISK